MEDDFRNINPPFYCIFSLDLFFNKIKKTHGDY
ncbi:hypothetical protein SAMN04515674_105278 [Pseudarcicella hirudinis]|uniref:Uncharacterized protein n=1 Tax=Pseudarcicella hirudinis TaxID=1079859 RepID=A0A1I5SYG0_9BACT|nr:hypothetical protein SAMN04515674_105278 [Pseudarcicella hirudinis]